MNDKIIIEDLEIYAYHGVFAEENRLGQKFLVSAELYTDFEGSVENDELELSVDYGSVCHTITEFVKNNTFKLIETVARKTAELLLEKYSLLCGVKITVKKPWAPIGLPIKTAGVSTELRWHKAYIALGSNMGDKQKYIDDAVKALDSAKGCRVEKVSDMIVTKPYGNVQQDDFLNGALCLKTYLEPHTLLKLLNEIEASAHRERLVHWGPRTLDLDIIMYDNLVLDDEELHIPHIDMHNREFVLKPMAQIAPYLRHPIKNLTIKELYDKLIGE